jgi:type II secretory pathway component PulF
MARQAIRNRLINFMMYPLYVIDLFMLLLLLTR